MASAAAADLEEKGTRQNAACVDTFFLFFVAPPLTHVCIFGFDVSIARSVVLVTGGSGLVGMALREVIQSPELNRPNERYIFIGSKDGDLWYAVLWFYFAACGLFSAAAAGCCRHCSTRAAIPAAADQPCVLIRECFPCVCANRCALGFLQRSRPDDGHL